MVKKGMKNRVAVRKWVKKCGIYRHPSDPDWVVLAIRTDRGTEYFPFKPETFLDGWRKSPPGWPIGTPNPYGTKARIEHAIEAVAKESGGMLSPEVEECFRDYKIRPEFLYCYGYTSQKRIKWAQRRSDMWGGRRPNCGRKPKEDNRR